MSGECKTCVWLDVKPNKAGKRVVFKNHGYKCLAPPPKMPPLPACITEDHFFSWPPHRSYVIGNWDMNCPCWKERT